LVKAAGELAAVIACHAPAALIIRPEWQEQARLYNARSSYRHEAP
jgi:hypothetical protein